MTITHINPESMHKNPAFSQGVLVEGGRTLYIGEQNGVDATSAIVSGGAAAQTRQAIDQVLKVLAEVGADQANVVKLTAYVAKDVAMDEVIGAAVESWGMHPTALTVLQVHALGRPDALVGIEAVASIR